MPRVNPDRSLLNERNLARRITYERQSRQPVWSYDGLAKRMTDHGSPMQKTTIFKIENGTRRITVDELVAFAAVFEVDVNELLIPVEFVTDRDAWKLLSDVAMSFDVIRGNATALMEHLGRYLEMDTSDEVREQFELVRRDPMSIENLWVASLPADVVPAYNRFAMALWRAAETRAKSGSRVVRPKNTF